MTKLVFSLNIWMNYVHVEFLEQETWWSYVTLSLCHYCWQVLDMCAAPGSKTAQL